MGTNLELLLIHPGTNRTVYENLANEYAAKEPPFMAGVIADAVRKKGHSVQVIDANALDIPHETLAQEVAYLKPKLVATLVHGHQPSASSQMMGAVSEMCTEIKKVSDVPILLGGVHPSNLPNRTLQEEDIDYIARGEEHPAILGLLDGALDSGELSKVPGLYYLDNGHLQVNPCPPEANLDADLSTVAWDLLPSLDNYRAHNWHAYFEDPKGRQPYGSLYTSLGCIFDCTFCMIQGAFKANRADTKRKGNSPLDVTDHALQIDVNKAKPGMRYWGADNVLKNLDYFAEQGVRHVKFIDEMFVLNNSKVNELADRMIERDYGFNIWAYARIDTVKDEALLHKLKEAGINWLALGIESANPDVRHGANKKFGNQDIFEHVKKVNDAGIDVLGNYMFGLRTDTQESMRETLDMAKELNTLWLNIYATMAYPGAQDYTWAKENGMTLPGDPGVPGGWTAYSHHSWFSLPLATESLTAAEVLEARDKAFNEYFGPENTKYRNLIQGRFGNKALEHVDQMVGKKIPRRLLGDPKPDYVK